MSENHSSDQAALENFYESPDTIPLISRNGSIKNDQFKEQYGIHTGMSLAGDYQVDYVNRSKIDNMIADGGENMMSMIPVVMGLLDQKTLDTAGIVQLQTHPYLDLRGKGTLVGFVDTGIDYTNEIFKYEDGTSKVQYIWDQSIPGSGPGNFQFGTEYSGDQINNALKSDHPDQQVPHRDTVGHGTFLASIAAGRKSGDHTGAAPDAEIIAVKMRKAQPFFYEHYLIPEWQENAYTSSDLMLGVQYILGKAAELGRPVAICIAVGCNMAGHDGYNVAEEYFTRISNLTGVAIACAAGNESQAKHHASAKIAKAGDSHSIELMVGEKSGDVYLTLWNGAPDRMAVTVKSPTGEMAPKAPVRSGTRYSSNFILEKSKVQVEYYIPFRDSGDQFTLIKIFVPTPGIWTITVEGEIVLDGSIHLWLPLTGFVDPDTCFLSPSPNYTIVTPASAVGVTTCGAYDSRNNSIFIDSSWGPTRLPVVAPDLVAPGINVGGVYPGGYGTMSGTSVSAAITAGACAQLLQWGIVDGKEKTLTSNRIRSNLIRGCLRSEGIDYPNEQWGYGRLNLYNSLNSIRPI